MNKNGSTTSSSGGISITGITIDRFAELPSNYLSAQINFQYLATIAATTAQNSFTITQTIQDAASTASFANFAASTPATTAATPQPLVVTIGGTTSTAAATLYKR